MAPELSCDERQRLKEMSDRDSYTVSGRVLSDDGFLATMILRIINSLERCDNYAAEQRDRA